MKGPDLPADPSVDFEDLLAPEEPEGKQKSDLKNLDEIHKFVHKNSTAKSAGGGAEMDIAGGEADAASDQQPSGTA